MRCENCESVLQGHYCHVCGQRAHNPLRHFAHALEEVFESFWHLDGRIFRTLHDLFVPGKLASAYLEGRRMRYIAPLRLFVIMSLLAFFVGKLTLHITPGTLVINDADSAPPQGMSITINDRKVGGPQYAKAGTIEEVAKIRAQALREIKEAKQDRSGRWFVAALGDAATRQIEQGAESRWKVLGATPEQIRRLRAADADASVTRDMDTGAQAKALAGTLAKTPAKPTEQSLFKRWISQKLERVQENAALVEKDPNVLVRLFLGALPGALFVLVPVFALFLKLAYLGSGRTYLEHLVVALYSHAFLLAALFAMFALIGLQSLTGWPSAVRIAILVAFVTIVVFVPLYLLWMQKRVYRQGWAMTMCKYLALGAVYSWLLSVGIIYALFAGLSS